MVFFLLVQENNESEVVVRSRFLNMRLYEIYNDFRILCSILRFVLFLNFWKYIKKALDFKLVKNKSTSE